MMIEIIPNWHPIFVHFTVALLSIAGILFIVGILAGGWQHRETAILVAKWNFWLGAIFTLLTITAGWNAYNTVAHDTASHLTMTTHRNWALTTFSVVLVLAIWLWLVEKRAGLKIGVMFLVPVVVLLGLLGVTAWYGGEAVYRHGLGVMSLPSSTGEGHAHDHGDGHGTKTQNDSKSGAHHDSIDGNEAHDHSTHKH